MKRLAVLLSLPVLIAIAVVQASASTPDATLLRAKTPDAAPQTQPLKPTSALAATPSGSRSHLFKVNDVKGLLLTCIAPEIDSNPETDVFKGCTLAPGRTLDDAMHTFVQGIHYEQSQHQKEREEWQKSLGEKASPEKTDKQGPRLR